MVSLHQTSDFVDLTNFQSYLWPHANKAPNFIVLNDK